MALSQQLINLIDSEFTKLKPDKHKEWIGLGVYMFLKKISPSQVPSILGFHTDANKEMKAEDVD